MKSAVLPCSAHLGDSGLGKCSKCLGFIAVEIESNKIKENKDGDCNFGTFMLTKTKKHLVRTSVEGLSEESASQSETSSRSRFPLCSLMQSIN